jgi:hypothetical protein
MIRTVCRWTTGDYTACSATCEGIQTRQVTCVCTSFSGATITTTDDVCNDQDPRIRPVANRSCGAPECPAVCNWTVGEFSDCSAICEGIQVRTVECQCTQSDGTTTVASGGGACESEEEPPTTQDCGGECPICRWASGPYSECSATCKGIQTRAVTCDCTDPIGSISTVDDAICEREDPRVRPSTSRSCGIECPVYRWAASNVLIQLEVQPQ